MNVSSLLVRWWVGWCVPSVGGRDGENATRYATVGMQMLRKGGKVSLDRARDKRGRSSRGWKLKLKLTFRCQISLLYLGGA